MNNPELIDNQLGLFAGNGKLPILVCQNAKKDGIKVFAICFDAKNFPIISCSCEKAIYLGPGEIEKIGQFLIENDIKQVIFIGKVSKELYFRNPKLDKRAITALAEQKRLNDDAIMLAAISELKKEGITVLEQTLFIKDFFARKGLIAGTPPSEMQQIDINYGFEIAKAIGKLDIGQTVVVKDKMILAAEAIEGTDQAIKRGAKLGKGNTTVVKVSKPSQDQRFDIPVVGLKTLKTMKKYGANVLAIEAGETLIVDEEEFIKTANKLKITVVAV